MKRTEREQLIWDVTYAAAYAKYYVSGGDSKREALNMAWHVATCAIEDLREAERANGSGG